MSSSVFSVISLFSGSKGNCTLVRCGATKVLIDAGMSCRAIERALGDVGETLGAISAVFLTHEHSDHTKALPILLKKHPVPVHAPADTVKTLALGGYPTDCFVPHPVCFSVTVSAPNGDDPMVFSSFPTPHDASVSVGYRIETAEGSAALATDLGSVTDAVRCAFSGCRNIVIESNHDENMLLMGSYPYELKRRILSDSGHLSNSACGDFVRELVAGGAQHILLAHLSPENNTPELAYLTVQTLLKQRGFREGEDYSLRVAARDKPVALFDEI